MEVLSRHHTKLIGRRGVVIQKVRTEHDVQIIFPEKVSSRPDVITIVGLEDKTKNARDDILKKVQEIVSTNMVVFVMVTLCNRADHYIFALWFLSIFFFFSLPNLSGRRLDVYHTSTHGVALV